MLRIDRPPAEVSSLVRRALAAVGADDVSSEGVLVVGTDRRLLRGTREIVVDLGVHEGDGVTVSVVARYRPGQGGGILSAPLGEIEQRFLDELESLARPDVTALQTPGEVAGDDLEERRSRPWQALADHEDVQTTGRTAGGLPVHETTAAGRSVTAEVVAVDGVPASAVVVGTPMRAARRGVGFEIRREDGTLRTETFEHTGTDPGTAIPYEGVWQQLDDLDRMGRLTVDDRLATVEHRIDSVADAEELLAHAEAVVAVARSVETETDAAGTA